MRCIILLAVVALAVSAPVENEDIAVRVRRAQEIVMFENEQNGSKDKVKRSDEEQVSDIDEQGKVISQEPVALDQTAQEDIDLNTIQPYENEYVKDNFENLLNNAESSDETNEVPLETTEETIDESVPLEPEEDAPDSEENDIITPADVSTELESNENEIEPEEEEEEEDVQNLYDTLLPNYYYKMMANNRQKPELDYYDLYRQYPYLRRRRSQERIFLGGKADRSRILKRSRRIKRDLLYPSDSLRGYGEDYAPDTNAYNNLVGYLLDLLDEKYNEESAYNNGVYGYDEPYEVDPYEELEEPVEDLVYPGYGERELEDAISKRQAGLTFVPGFKRNFYPYFEEPASHFQAFVPEKRTSDEYADVYRRVMGLASALRQSDYYPADRYQDYDFRRK